MIISEIKVFGAGFGYVLSKTDSGTESMSTGFIKLPGSPDVWVYTQGAPWTACGGTQYQSILRLCGGAWKWTRAIFFETLNMEKLVGL